MTSNDAWDLGGGGENFQFERIGDKVGGFIQDMQQRQGTDLDTNEPAWWDDAKTRPVMLTLVVLQTNLRNGPQDDGKRTLTLSGSKKPNPDGTMSRMAAALAAVKLATGGTQMQFNGWLEMTFTSEGQRTKPAFNPPKYYQAVYRPPAMDLAQDNMVASGPAPSQQPADPWAVQQSPQAGANWPNQQTATVVSTASGQPVAHQVNTGTGEIVNTGGTLNGEAAITPAEVAAIQQAGLKPESVWGPNWRQRVTP